MTGHSERLVGSKVETQDDGTYRLILANPCTDSNKERFLEELEFALAFAKEYAVTVWWLHNSARVSTDDDLAGDAWAVYTLRSSHMGN